ncbi:MAG: ubiquitin-like domain-containing protein [Chloroflexi bacterium]|nr:ubiquitin-like domain-containing protein [Chloroflexota bacterium]
MTHTSHQPKARPSWLAIPLVLAALSTLTAGYLSTFTPAKIIDGSRVIDLQTHQTTVGAALRESAIELLPEDSVSPDLTAPLNRNDTIIIKRARLVSVRVDNQEPELVRTQSKSVAEVLELLGYSLGERDFLSVNGQPVGELPDAPSAASNSLAEPVTADIDFRHAVELTVQEQEHSPVTIFTTAPTIGEALMQAGYTIYLADTVRPSPAAPAQSGTHVFITRSRPVSVWVDGRRIKTRTHRAVVADVLADLNIVLYGEDYARPELNTAISDNTEIKVVRVRHEVVINQDVIPFETRWEANVDLELDHEALGQEGQPGVHERRTLVYYEDNAEIKRELIADFVAREPQDKIYNYGTKVVVRTMQTPSGPVEYWRVIRMLATSYSASTAGVSRSASYYGRVRCGFAMRSGIVAVDPRLIPLGTNVYVDGYGVGNACDTGSAIIGKRIDLGYDDNNLQLWYRWVDVYLLTPVPANVRLSLDD